MWEMRETQLSCWQWWPTVPLSGLGLQEPLHPSFQLQRRTFNRKGSVMGSNRNSTGQLNPILNMSHLAALDPFPNPLKTFTMSAFMHPRVSLGLQEPGHRAVLQMVAHGTDLRRRLESPQVWLSLLSRQEVKPKAEVQRRTGHRHQIHTQTKFPTTFSLMSSGCWQRTGTRLAAGNKPQTPPSPRPAALPFQASNTRDRPHKWPYHRTMLRPLHSPMDGQLWRYLAGD